MGVDGLILFLQQSNVQALRSIGCEDRWIRKKLEDGILSLIDKCYSKSISTKIWQHAHTLKQMRFLQGASYFDVNELSINGYSSDPRFISEERFLECEGTLEESRVFIRR
jgi:hypothetical protein